MLFISCLHSLIIMDGVELKVSFISTLLCTIFSSRCPSVDMMIFPVIILSLSIITSFSFNDSDVKW